MGAVEAARGPLKSVWRDMWRDIQKTRRCNGRNSAGAKGESQRTVETRTGGRMVVATPRIDIIS